MTNGEFRRAMHDACHPHGYVFTGHRVELGGHAITIDVVPNAVTGPKITLPALRDVVDAAMPFPYYPRLVLGRIVHK